MIKIPVLVALERELPGTLPSPYVKVLTGVGKVNAAIAAMQAIAKYQPIEIINFGTAGSLNPAYSTGIYQVSAVAQRDMDTRSMGFELGQTPFEPEVWLPLSGNGPTLSSGDAFVEARPELESDLVDMEAFAIAKACVRENVSLTVYKFVSDQADGDAAASWEENCDKGAALFMEALEHSSK